MSTTPISGAAEWRRGFMLPLVAALGYATSVIHIYGLNPYIQPISQEFGWSITQTTFGLTIAVFVQAIFGVPIGIMVDKIGPRVLGLVGVIATCGCFALIGTANGDKLNWYLLWLLLAFAVLPVQATIWTSAVASRFEASRGLAFAITLCGASVAATVFPYLGTRLIAAYGWQQAFAYQALIWVLFAWPLIMIFFRSASDRKDNEAEAAIAAKNAATGTTFTEGLRSTSYLRLLLASLCFTFAILGIFVHYIDVLADSGADRLEAAKMASLVGIFSIVGRLGTGFLLDRFNGAYVGAVVFLLPVVGCLLLIMGGDSVTSQLIASAFIGLTLGAEVDVIVYLTTRHFGLKSFGALYGGLLAALSVGTATGPLVAAWTFDQSGSFATFLWITIGFMIASSLALVTLPRPKFGFD